MLSKRHLAFNIVMIIFPWLTLFFLGKRNIKRYFLASFVTVIFELINAKIGQKRKWWIFNNKTNSFITNELPFSAGPYIPLSMWILKLTYGNFKKFLLLNIVADGLFAFILTKILNKIKIARLGKLSEFQFFIYLFYKTFLLYGVQYFVENKEKFKIANP
ncbi:hypothetical protein J2S74_000145 [Evansella vedderi]|uniref:Uncharacterized protein n=1 Tax=Evansella vedderi TaxID=38282 RepID=A0ABT9ZQQ0_9BACI|nr:hypothetical protein [Evansella vedderi]MDQ0252773.1 hypothetical protein [Evansella vedderi]